MFSPRLMTNLIPLVSSYTSPVLLNISPNFSLLSVAVGCGVYNPQIQIFAEFETKRPFFESSFKTKRPKKGLARNTNNKARNKSQNHSISGLGFVKHNSTGNIIAFK